MTDILLGFVGDLLVNRDDPEDAFRDIRPVLASTDILFGNMECSYTDHPHPVPSAPVVVSAPAHNLDVYSKVGFNVLALANNHILDAGYKAMLEARERLKKQGIETCGAGSNAGEAHQPALVQVEGVRIAYLGYCTAFPAGYEARGSTPGLAPMRAYRYVRDPDPTDESLPLDIITTPDPRDLAALTEDIQRARASADLVVASFHWGDYTRRHHLTNHERTTARYCVDQGVHMVVGHGHHVLRGMEWYKGKPIMYGLGHYVLDLRWTFNEELLAMIASYEQASAAYTIAPRPGWPLLPMHEDARMTVLAWATANRDGIRDIGFLPCRLTPEGRVHPLHVGSPQYKEVVTFLEQCNATQGLTGRIVASGGVTLGGFETLRVVPH